MEPRVEYALFDFALVLLSDPNVTIVPLSQSTNAEEVAVLLKKTNACCIVYSASFTSIVNEAISKSSSITSLSLIALPALTNVDVAATRHASMTAAAAIKMYTLDSFVALGNENYRVPRNVDHKHGTNVCIFSSGSTGEPKGIVISAQAWQISRSEHLTLPWVGVLYQSLGHSSGRRCLYNDVMGGGRVYCCPFTHELRAIIRQVRPTLLSATPRFWNSLHQEFVERLATIDGGDTLANRSKLCKEFAFELGGRVRICATGQ